MFGRPLRAGFRAAALGGRAPIRTAGNQVAPLEGIMTVQSDGIWTWFTMPEAVQYGANIYVGWVNSAGTCGATQISLSDYSVKHFSLSSVGLEVDDHNNASILVMPDGRITFFYGMHNDTVFRYRIWDGSGAFDSSGSWTAEAARGTGNTYSYPKPHIFPGDTTAGRVWLFYRRWIGGGTTRALSFRSSDTLTGTSDPWGTSTDAMVETGHIPYFVACQDGDKLHFAGSSQHPVESGFVTVVHFYAEMVSGALEWKASDGTALVTDFAAAEATRADDGGDLKRWVSGISVGDDGHPRILFMRYPNNDGSAIEYWHSRWTGSAWTAHKITDDGAGLYSPEVYYHGGLRFHEGDTTRVYLSAPISGVRQIQEWRTTDDGATWSQYRVITSGGTAGTPLKLRPVGVHNGDGRVNVLWCEGTYTTYTNYSTAIKGSA